MTDERIQQLIREFEKGIDSGDQKEKQEEFESLRAWFQDKFGIDNIGKITQEDVLTFAKKIDKKWCGNRGEGFWQPGLYQGQWEKMVEDIDKFRVAIKFLLYDKGKVEDRINAIQSKEGPYSCPVLKGELLIVATAFLVVHQPEEFVGILSMKDKRKILKNLNRLPPTVSPENIGEEFVRLNDVFIKFKEDCGLAEWNNYYKFLRFMWEHIRGEKDIVEYMLESEAESEGLFREQHLQHFIHQNLNSIGLGVLRYYDEDEQNSKYGKYNTNEIGEIDFLCVDAANNFLVIELKRKGSDKAVGQICRYLGWVEENLCKGDQKVKGLIITQESDSKLEYALQIVPSVTIKYLKVTFNLSDKPV